MTLISFGEGTSPPPAPPLNGPSSPASASRRAPRARGRRREGWTAVAFLTPAVLALLLLRVLPAGKVLLDSVRQGLPGSSLPPRFVGLDNFAALADSPSFWNSVQQTLVFNLLINPLQIGVALALACLLTSRLRGAGLWRTVIFLPSAVPILGSTIVWGIALRPDGPVNGVLAALGQDPQPFLTSPDTVLWSLILLASWIGIGYWMMFLIAGLYDVPAELYEAAQIDGAGPLRTFWHITLPMIKRPLLFVLVADTVANFVLFAPIQVLTNGGPEEASNLLMFDVYRNAYDLADPYTASAELLVLLAIMLLVVVLQFRLLRDED